LVGLRETSLRHRRRRSSAVVVAAELPGVREIADDQVCAFADALRFRVRVEIVRSPPRSRRRTAFLVSAATSAGCRVAREGDRGASVPSAVS